MGTGRSDDSAHVGLPTPAWLKRVRMWVVLIHASLSSDVQTPGRAFQTPEGVVAASTPAQSHPSRWLRRPADHQTMPRSHGCRHGTASGAQMANVRPNMKPRRPVAKDAVSNWSDAARSVHPVQDGSALTSKHLRTCSLVNGHSVVNCSPGPGTAKQHANYGIPGFSSWQLKWRTSSIYSVRERSLGKAIDLLMTRDDVIRTPPSSSFWNGLYSLLAQRLMDLEEGFTDIRLRLALFELQPGVDLVVHAAIKMG